MQFLICFFVCLYLAASFGENIVSQVLVLNKSNFNHTLAKNKYILIEFYAPWCGHCKALEPEYEKAAKQLVAEKSDIVLAKVDATQENDLAEKYGADSYPTIVFAREGKPVPFGGGLTAEEIINWLKRKTGPPVVTLKTVEEAKQFMESANVVIVGLFRDLEGREAKYFEEVADEEDDHLFAISSEKSVYKAMGAEKDGVFMFKTFDEGRHQLDGQISVESIETFIDTYSLPLVTEVNEDNSGIVFGGYIQMQCLLFISKSSSKYASIVGSFQEVAKEFRGKVIFAAVNIDDDYNEEVMGAFGLKKEDVPVLRLIDSEKGLTKFKPQEKGITEDITRAFVGGVLEGSHKEYLLSQDLPQDWDKSPVKTLVASNFDEVAFDTKKNVLVEFYAPWCGHCKSLEPVYNELGLKYKDRNDVVVAKMDGTQNELVHSKTNGYPTIKLYKKGANESIDYNGERTLAGLSLFIESGGEEDGSGVEGDEEGDEGDEWVEGDELNVPTARDEL